MGTIICNSVIQGGAFVRTLPGYPFNIEYLVVAGGGGGKPDAGGGGGGGFRTGSAK